MKPDTVMDLVRVEIQIASRDWPDYHSAHEGYGVLAEEVAEVFDDVRSGDTSHMALELVQVAAVAIRFAMCVCDESAADLVTRNHNDRNGAMFTKQEDER